MNILYEDTKVKLQDEKDKTIGQLTFEEQADNKLIITHTYVNQNYRGEGLAEKLVEALVEKAEKDKKKIIKNEGCSYVVYLFEEKSEKYHHITVEE